MQRDRIEIESFGGRAQKVIRQFSGLICHSNALGETAITLPNEVEMRRTFSKIFSFSRETAKPVKHPVSNLEQALLKSDDWLQLVAEGSELGLWHWDEVKQSLHWDLKTRQMFGAPTHGKVTLQTFEDALHPDDHDRVLRHWRHCFENSVPYSIEYRAVRSDGSVRWIDARGKEYCDKAGKPLYMVGVVFDITERKEAEQERLELSGRLINAQEQERTRLARDLHDDFSQRLAILANELEMIAEMTKDFAAEVSKRVHELWNLASEIGADLHSLSHRLHSSRLETLGLAASVDSYCKEFAQKYAIHVDAVCEELPKSIPPETTLCIFRVLQEALRNVIKHSHATRVEVQLRDGDGESISLTLSDDGVGFDPSQNYGSQGIGILSMRERVRMLGGTFDVHSRPTEGAKIAVTVPLNSARSAA